MSRDSRSFDDSQAFAKRRRQALGAFGALGALAIAACGGGSSSDSGSDGSTTASTDATLSGLALSTGTLSPAHLSSGCAPISGAGIYIWHCDKDGIYSGYATSTNAGSTSTTFLRGVQVTGSDGQVIFTTIYPGWYAGRITHIHAQVHLNDGLVSGTAIATTQLAFPIDITTAVYDSSLYTKGQNTSVTTFSADNVFSDGTSTEMLSLTGDTASGYAATMTISIA